MMIRRLLLDKTGGSKLRGVFRHPLFWGGLVAKLIAGSLFASGYLTEMFIPFVNTFVESGFDNPYRLFVEAGNSRAFPYPALMLYILAVPRTLLTFMSDFGPFEFLTLFTYRLPILLADIVILVVFVRWLKTSMVKTLIFYWASPVLFYISYVHGQLDAIPIAILFVGMYFLFKERFLIAAVLVGLSLATKTNVLIAVPFFFLYINSKRCGLRTMAYALGIIVGVFTVVNAPFLASPEFRSMVFDNAEQAKIFSLKFSFIGDRSIYLIPVALLLLFVRGAMIKSYNKDFFFVFLGFSFGILLLLIPPMPGWYFWVVPLFSYFYIREKSISPIPFLALQAAYILYFLVIPESDYLQVLQPVIGEAAHSGNFAALLARLGISVTNVSNLALTLLQTMLLINCLIIYRLGVRSYLLHKISATPYLIGIGGDSGCGKTTLSSAIEGVFHTRNTTVIRGDDMHRWERGHEKWAEFTHLDPRANELHAEVNYLSALRRGQPIYRRHYDHTTGQFSNEQMITGNKIIIFEGLHPFFIQSVRELYDLKIFITPEQQLARHWKIVRDRAKRGYKKEQVLEQIRLREDDSNKFIAIQEKYADILVEMICPEQIPDDLFGEDGTDPIFHYKLRVKNTIYLAPLIEALKLRGVYIKHQYEGDYQHVELSGGLSSEELDAIAYHMIPGLEEIGVTNPSWCEGTLGVVQLFITYYIMEYSLGRHHQA